MCNTLGIRDYEGKSLDVDGLPGDRTRYCVARLPLCGIKFTQPVATQYIQQRLRDLGYNGINGLPLDVDGVFFTNSAFSLANYQRDRQLLADGICGQNTWLRFI